MVGAIVQGSLQADHGITGQRALLNGFLNALLNGGVEVLGDGAAEDFLSEDHVVLLLLRLEANPDVAELAAAAGLLLVTAMSLYLLLDLLPVGDLRRIQHGVHAEAALQLGDQHVQPEMTCCLVSALLVRVKEGSSSFRRFRPVPTLSS